MQEFAVKVKNVKFVRLILQNWKRYVMMKKAGQCCGSSAFPVSRREQRSAE